jgi:hypothetical protein
MQRLVEKTGGMAMWLQADRADIERLLVDLFNEFPSISQQAFSPEHTSVGFENIFRYKIGDRLLFQTPLRTNFVYLCMVTWEYRIKRNEKPRAYDLWEKHMHTRVMCGLDIGSIGNLISRRTRITSGAGLPTLAQEMRKNESWDEDTLGLNIARRTVVLSTGSP